MFGCSSRASSGPSRSKRPAPARLSSERVQELDRNRAVESAIAATREPHGSMPPGPMGRSSV